MQELWAAPASGLLNGVLTGMTGSFVVPGVMYLNALNLSRDQLIQSMGMLFTLSTLSLALALDNHALLSQQQLINSSLALIPAIAGMLLGQAVRRAIPEAVFRRVFFLSLLLLGTYIIVAASRGMS